MQVGLTHIKSENVEKEILYIYIYENLLNWDSSEHENSKLCFQF
jgi:hypothetical protein